MDIKQDFKGLDGAIAWHLIERQAENWNQVGEMMNEWLKANTPTKEWVWLTAEDADSIECWFREEIENDRFSVQNLISRIEAKLKEKNA